MLTEEERKGIEDFHVFFEKKLNSTIDAKNKELAKKKKPLLKHIPAKGFLKDCFADFYKMEIATNYPSYRNALIHTSICGNANIPNDDSAPKGYVMTKNMSRKTIDIDNTTLTDVKQNNIQKVLLYKICDKPMYKHIEELDDVAQSFFAYYEIPLEEVHNLWEEIKNRTILPKDTDNLIAQVFFNINEGSDEHHLLSVYSNSALARQTHNMLFSRKKNGFFASNIMERYYGDKSRNITTFMKSNYYSFASCPPMLETKKNAPFSSSIFKNIVVYQLKDSLETLAKTLKDTEFVKNEDSDSFSQKKALNKRRKDKVASIISSIVKACFDYRNNLLAKEEGWTEEKPFDKLPLHQRIWIDNNYLAYRLKRKNTDWAEKLSKDFSDFVVNKYNHVGKCKDIHELNLDDIAFFEKTFFDMLYSKG